MVAEELGATEVYRHTSRINVVKYQPASGLLYCGTHDGRILGLDVAAGFRLVLDIETGLSSVAGLDVHAAGPIVAVSGQGTHQAWDCARKVRLFHESYSPYDQNPGDDGFCLRFHVPPPGAPASDWVLFGSFGDFVARNVHTGEKRPLFVGSDYNVWIAFHPAGDLGVASCLEPQDSTFFGLFDFNPNADHVIPYTAPLIRFEPVEGAAPDLTMDVPAYCVFSPDGDYLVTAWANMNLMQTRAEIEEMGALVGVLSVYRFPECDLLHEIPILGQREDMLEYEGYDQQTGKPEPVYGTPGFVSNLVLLGSGGIAAACGTPGGRVALIDWVKGEVIQQPLLHEGEVTSVETISLMEIVSAGQDGRVVLLNSKEFLQTSDLPKATAADALAEAGRRKQEFLEKAVAGSDSFYA